MDHGRLDMGGGGKGGRAGGKGGRDGGISGSDGGKGGRGGGKGRGDRRARLEELKASSVPTAVLSFHQPLASMVAYGMQRLDGRVWRTNYCGPLWIHAAAKEPTEEEIADMEEFHTAVFESLTADARGDEDAKPTLPSSYPTSCLLGCVDMVGCVSAEEYATWPLLPDGVREEAQIHGSGQYLLFENHRRLVLPQQMPGQHKLWQLDHQLAKALWEGNALRPTAQAPVSWIGHQEAAAAHQHDELSDGAGATSARPTAPTPAMRRNARRTAAKQTQVGGAVGTGVAAGATTTAAVDETPEPAPPAAWPPAAPLPQLRYYGKDGSLVTVPTEREVGGHLASASSPAVAEYQARLAAAALCREGCDVAAVACCLSKPLEWAEQWCQPETHSIPRPRSLPDWLPTDCFRDVELRRGYADEAECKAILHELLSRSVSRSTDCSADAFWRPALYLNRSRETGELEVATDGQGQPVVANSRLQASYDGGIAALDAVLSRSMLQWGIVTAGCRVLLNRYDSGEASIATHRHDFWSVLLSLGGERVFLLDERPILLRAGDLLVMGTQKHGVPRQPDRQDTRVSVALFFEPPRAAAMQRWRASAAPERLSSSAAQGHAITANGAAHGAAQGAVGRTSEAEKEAEHRLAVLQNCQRMLPLADLTASLAGAAAELERASAAAGAAAAAKARAVRDRKARQLEVLAAQHARGEELDANQLAKLREWDGSSLLPAAPPASASAPTSAPGAVSCPPGAVSLPPGLAGSGQPRPSGHAAAASEDDPMDEWMLAQAVAMSVAADDANAAARQQAAELAAALEAVALQGGALDVDVIDDDAGAAGGDDLIGGDYMEADDRIVDDDWSDRVVDLTRMGFERERAVEMLTLCNGDVEQAVQLLCS